MSLPMRLAPVVGVYGISFLFALTGAALAQTAVRRERRELAWLLLLAPLWFLGLAGLSEGRRIRRGRPAEPRRGAALG